MKGGGCNNHCSSNECYYTSLEILLGNKLIRIINIKIIITYQQSAAFLVPTNTRLCNPRYLSAMAPKRVHKGGRGKRSAQDEVIGWKKGGMSDVGIRSLLVDQGYSKARVSQLMKAAGCKPGPYSKWDRLAAQANDKNIADPNADLNVD